MKKMHILLLGLLPILLLFVTCARDTPSSVSPSAVQTDITLAKNSNIDAFDMNDRFGAPPSGAKGNGTVKVINGQMDLMINGRNLIANHDYEVHVAIGKQNQDCDIFDPTTLALLRVFRVTSDKNGKLKFKIVGLDLGLDPGEYRGDYVLVHRDHGGGSHGGFVLACEPASCLTI